MTRATSGRYASGRGPSTNGDFVYTPGGTPQLTWAATYPPAVGNPGVRAWESQGAGLTFELEGPDAQSVTMPPCPSVDSQELIAEMAEVYWMALCRDRPFADSRARRRPRVARSRADNWLLPMAFPEGSPTHPSYGAGHATVAGACVTILKAWFDHGWPMTRAGSAIAFEPEAVGSALVDVSASLDRPLTVEGELNKVAANIAIGRDWAGVHYYTDYIESFRLGERIALGLLEEQKLTYGETFSLTVALHDGTSVQI
ncbi:MAG: hypothetical protein M3459_04665 [Actinomycetota bacterium]|nr:hypothetical protein [Actinomycetota bacterium]